MRLLAKTESITTQEDTPVPITLIASDPDGDNMIYTIVSQPSHGLLSSTMPNTIYTPNTNYNGYGQLQLQGKRRQK